MFALLLLLLPFLLLLMNNSMNVTKPLFGVRAGDL
jgi:hypothetical protein